MKVTYGTETLQSGVDYYLSYYNCYYSTGKAYIEIIGQGRFVGTKTVYFTITGTPISKAKVTGIENRVFNEQSQTQDLKVIIGDKVLEEGMDYYAYYENNMNVGTATITIEGRRGYTGKIKKTFKITPYDIGADTDKLMDGIPENLVVTYEKGGVQPKIELKYKEYILREGKDYTISYANNGKVTLETDKKKPTMTIKGKGNFKGSIVVPFTIAKKDLEDEANPVSVCVKDIAAVNRAGKYISTPVLIDSNGKKLVAGTDYDKALVYTLDDGTVLNPKTDSVPAGKNVTVTVKGKGNYEGELKATYRITKASFNSAKITIKAKTYTGKPIKLSGEDITVMMGKTPLVYGKDFVVLEGSYVNNIAKGTASVTIKGAGEYGGEKVVKFKINPRSIAEN